MNFLGHWDVTLIYCHHSRTKSIPYRDYKINVGNTQPVYMEMDL